MTPHAAPDVRAALAPSGTLRIGLNYGNFLLFLTLPARHPGL